MLIAHLPIAPSELWLAWNRDPIVWCILVAAALIYRELSSQAVAPWQRHAFAGGMVVAAVALVSPLDALASSLASAHMVQHLLLTLLAAPLLVLGAPASMLVLGLPDRWRRHVRRGRRLTAVRRFSRWLGRPIVAGALFVVVLWAWHARALYEAALQHHLLHGLEHATFLVTALLSWAAVFAAAQRRRRDGIGLSVLVLFGLSIQCAVLGALMTFAPSPWYLSYLATTEAWGLSPLADQQLAGVIMWVPAGGVYLVAALVLVRAWLNAPPRHRRSGGQPPRDAPPGGNDRSRAAA